MWNSHQLLDPPVGVSVILVTLCAGHKYLALPSFGLPPLPPCPDSVRVPTRSPYPPGHHALPGHSSGGSGPGSCAAVCSGHCGDSGCPDAPPGGPVLCISQPVEVVESGVTVL